MKIKVAMVAEYPDEGDRIDGGVQAVTSYLVSAFASIPEIELHVISFRFGLGERVVTQRGSLTHYLLPFGGLGTLTGFSQDQAALNACLAEIDPDVVHSQGAGHHGILVSRCPYPSVVTIHGIHVQEAAYLTGIRRRFRTRLQGWMSQHYCIRKASNTIMISPYVSEYFGDKLNGERYLIPNPVDDRFFEVERQEKPGRVLFLGRLYALKGLSDLIEAVSRVEGAGDVQLILGGSLSDSEYVEELKAQTKRLNMEDSVRFKGILSTDELLVELSRASCLVLPSYQETAPMVIQEAMAAGVPTIASDICGIPYQITHEETGFLFSPGDVGELARHLETLLTSNTVRESLSNAARERADQQFRASAVAEKTLDVYRAMIT